MITVERGGNLTIQNSTSADTGTPGTITGGNAANGNGGGVYNEGTFTMEGGAIYGNSAENAAADFYNAPGGKFTLARAEGCSWYVDEAGQRYAEGCWNPYKIPESESSGVIYLAAVQLEGDGTEIPYKISTAAELAAFRDIVNGNSGGEKESGACAKLTDNITIYEGLLNADGSLNENNSGLVSWEPIGGKSGQFYSGTFDGNGCTISGLYCDSSSGSSTLYAGLFGIVGGGTVQNLKVEDSFVSASGGTSGGTSGKAGGICGENSGTITGCTFRGSVSGSDASTVTVGGVCGTNAGTVTNCWNAGSVTAKGSASSLKAGGVCGTNNRTVTNCLNTGTVTATGDNSNSNSNYAGGVCGENVNFSSVTNCLNTGKVTAETTGEGKINIGGVCGNNDPNATVTNCYYSEESANLGIGNGDDQEKATAKTGIELASGEVAYRLNTENVTAPWRQNLGGENPDLHPVLDASHGVVDKTEGGDYINIESEPEPEPEPSRPTGSDSHNDSEPTYSPSLDVSDGGAIKVSPRTPEAGETVTITPTPEAGYDVGTVTDRNGKEIPVTEHRNSTWTFEQPRGRVTIEVTFVPTGEVVGETPFLDVAPGAWYADAVAYVYGHGLMSGTSAAAFSPNATTTRAMIVTMLYRLEGEPDVNFGSSFNDVDASMYYADAVAWASQNGIVTGYDDAAFAPNDAITREQMAAILYRYAQYKGYDTAAGGMALREYEDYAAISQYALEAMGWAVSEGLVTGTSSTILTPEGSAIRAQVAAIFMRFMENIVQ